MSIDSEGTVNCVVILEDRILVGVDSRSTKKHKDKETSEEHRLWRKDEGMKIKEFGSGLLLTTCGNVAKKNELWSYLDSKKPDNILEARKIIESFLRSDSKLPSKHLALFLVGYCDTTKEFVVYYMGDGETTERRLTKDTRSDPFYAIGSGSGFGKLSWRRTNKTLDDSNSVVTAVSGALVNACLEDPSCGGLLRMRWVYEGRVAPIGADEHLIDVMLKLRTPFKRSAILIFSKLNHLHVNYYTVMKHFIKDYGCELKKLPKCLGYAVPGEWTCFLVDVVGNNDEDLSDDYFTRFCRPINYDLELLRYTPFLRAKSTRKKVKKISIVVMRATHDNLRQVREENLLANV